MSPYRKPWDRLFPSCRTELDRDFRAFHMRQTVWGYWIPMGNRSKKRFQQLVRPKPCLLKKFRSEGITAIMSADPPLRSIPNEYWPDLMRLAKHLGYTIYVNKLNVTPKLNVSSRRNQYKLERDYE